MGWRVWFSKTLLVDRSRTTGRRRGEEEPEMNDGMQRMMGYKGCKGHRIKDAKEQEDVDETEQAIGDGLSNLGRDGMSNGETTRADNVYVNSDVKQG